MLKTLDILIGATTVILIFSMAVTVITQAITSMRGRRGKHLAQGLADLLQQMGISTREVAEQISEGVLRHPMFSDGNGWWGMGKAKLGTVISREEFTKILLDAGNAIQQGGDAGASGLWSCLKKPAQDALLAMLKQHGVNNPGPTLDNVRALAVQLEASNPELANDVRQSLALLHEAPSQYVSRVNAWFDQTIDRVSARFTKYTHYVTLGVATVVVLTVQLDIIAVVDRLSVDDKLRNGIVASAIKDVDPQTDKTKDAAAETQQPTTQQSQTAGAGSPASPTQGDNGAGQDVVPKLAAAPYYDALSAAGLITVPGFDSNARNTWAAQWSASKIPGMILAILLVSLGAPFWYGILKDLLGLRSALAKKDDAQRLIRQTTQSIQPDVTAVISETAGATPAWLQGEQGDLGARG